MKHDNNNSHNHKNQATNGNDFIHTGPKDDVVNGGKGNDVIFTKGGNDRVDGGQGIDFVSAGRGDDVATFVLSENSGPRWRLPDFYDGGKGTDELRLVLTAAEWAKPEIHADILAYLDFVEAGSNGPFKFHALNLVASQFESLEVVVDGIPIDPRGEAPEVIDRSGSTQNETIQTGAGDDIVRTGSGNDVINTGSGDDLIESGAGDDTVTIGDGDDVVRTGDGNDTIIAGQGGGNDIIDGGASVDLVAYDSITAFGIEIDLREADRSGLDIGGGKTAGDLLAGNGYAANTPAGTTRAIDPVPANVEGVGTDLLIGIENARGGGGGDRITGSDGTNWLYGAGGNDELNGLDGGDVLYGGDGADSLNGGAGDDILDGGAGADTVDGGAGFDTLVLEGTSSEYEFIPDGQGGYSVRRDGDAPASWEAMKSIEQVAFSDTTLPTWAITESNFIVGDDTAETIDGTPGRDNIDAKGGDDSIYGHNEEDWITGGAGNDLIVASEGTYDDDNFVWDAIDYMREGGPQGVTVNLATGVATDSFGDTDTLVGIERVAATNFADSIIGAAKGEGLEPHGGDDFIDGGDGYDQLMYHLSDGVGGHQGIVVEFSSTVEGAGAVLSDPWGDTDIFVNIEAIRGTKYVDVVTGGAGFQEFRGFDGADTFDGGDGYDLARYREDVAYGGQNGISVDLAVVDAQGYATLSDAFGAADRLKNVEEIVGTGTADVMRGDAAANVFRGDNGADIMDGRAGNDELRGDLGNDDLDGGADDDLVIGGVGADTIDGGTGNDWLIGGEGADVFEFHLDSGDDTIEDYESGGTDAISLEDGITIASISYANVAGQSADETIVELSTGSVITLLDTSVLQQDLLLV